jgi:hypothetical protein
LTGVVGSFIIGTNELPSVHSATFVVAGVIRDFGI